MSNTTSYLKFGKTIFGLSIFSVLFILYTSYANVYQIKWVGILFEILWLPVLLVILVTPALSLYWWFKERFMLQSIFFYTFLLSVLAIVLMALLVKTH